MSGNRTESEGSHEPLGGSKLAGTACCPTGPGRSWPGGDVGSMMWACHCKGWLRRHRLAAYTAVAVFGLGLLALQVGWILGVIAFFRTI